MGQGRASYMCWCFRLLHCFSPVVPMHFLLCNFCSGMIAEQLVRFFSRLSNLYSIWDGWYGSLSGVRYRAPYTLLKMFISRLSPMSNIWFFYVRTRPVGTPWVAFPRDFRTLGDFRAGPQGPSKAQHRGLFMATSHQLMKVQKSFFFQFFQWICSDCF